MNENVIIGMFKKKLNSINRRGRLFSPQNIFLLFVALGFLFSESCSNSPQNIPQGDETLEIPDDRTFETFIDAYKEAGYTLKMLEKPHERIKALKAKDGIELFIGSPNSRDFMIAVLFLEYESEKEAKKIINCGLNGKFACFSTDPEIQSVFYAVEKQTIEVPNLLSESELQGTDLQKIKTLPKDFEIFLQKFTQNRETQISLINTPFSIYMMDDDEGLQETIYSKENLEEDWNFENADWFLHNDGFDVVFNGKEDVIVCTVSKPESCYVLDYVFKKIDGNWRLFEFINYSN